MTTTNWESRQKVAGEVRAEAARQKVTVTALAEATGMSRVILGRKLNGSAPIGIEELVRISRALNVPMSRFLAAAEEAAA